MILCGQVILGEVLACPSASKLNGVTACLLDCNDMARIEPASQKHAWSHAGYAVAAIDWQAGDARWQTWVLDTRVLGVAAVGQQVASWIEQHQ
jgi:hypothetical protein